MKSCITVEHLETVTTKITDTTLTEERKWRVQALW